MKVLLTGAAGYIGAVASPILTAAGHEVTGLDVGYFDGCDFLDPPPRATLRRDVRGVTVSDLAGYDAVVHLAGLSNDPMGALNSDWTYDINFRATADLALRAKEAGVGRFVFSSSCSMYGASDSDSGVTEEAPLKPLSAYAESKARSEEALSDLADSSFVTVYMRNATVYGASPRLRVDLVLNNLVAWAHTTGEVRLLSDGTAWRPIVHVADVAHAMAAALAAPAASINDQAFNVGRNDENYRIRDIADIVQQTVPGTTVEYAADADADPRSYRVSFDKLSRTFPELELEWDARRGAAELYAAYSRAGFTSDDLHGSQYTRLKRLVALMEADQLDDELRWRAPDLVEDPA